MANNTTGRPMLLDTVAVIFDATYRVQLSGARYINATTPGHKVVITDASDNVLYSLSANGNQDPETLLGGPATGLKVASIDSGAILLYVTSVSKLT